MKKVFAVFLSVVLAVTGFSAALIMVDFNKNAFHLTGNTIFYDRNGRLISFRPDSKGERHLWMPVDEVPQMVKYAFLAAEDSRFFSHPGFDLPAILRALKDNIRHGKVVSGASTITQQTVRLVYHGKKRSYLNKLVEIMRSIRTELAFTKEEILEQYLNRVPMGGNIVGVELASRAYFGQSCTSLTVAQAAVLASLPRAPSFLSPYGKNRAALLKRRDIILRNMASLGYLKEQEYEKALREKVVFQRLKLPNHAPHLANLLLKRSLAKPGQANNLTIDLDFQSQVDHVLRSHEKRLAYRGASQTACLVVHNHTMEVLASVGSLSYSSKNQGYNSGVTALRSAGSTLKPLLYAEALDSGYTAASLFEDTLQNYRTPFGDYRPYNYDKKEYGPVTMRVALSNSLNITAIKMLEKLGSERFYNVLKRVNLINASDKPVGHYGLGMAVGNLEVTLEQLVRAYALFPNSGLYQPLRYLQDANNTQNGQRLFSDASAYIISDILSDASARTITFGHTGFMHFPFRVALKTGTSSDYRDAWLIGYTSDYTIGLWTGNFDGSPTYNLSGAEANVPILKDLLNLLYKNSDSPPAPLAVPESVVSQKVCGISGMVPGPYCAYVTEELFIKGTEPVQPCTFHQKERYLHQLPPSFAIWVSRKQSYGQNYQIDGLNHMDDNTIQPAHSQNEHESTVIEKDGQNASPEHYTISTNSSGKKHSAFELERIITITYPLPHDRFVLTNTETAIELQVRVDKTIQYVDWFIDGLFHCRSGLPYNCIWKMRPGLHRISAVNPDNQGDSVEIMVD
ncbi:MAG TPA: penicillin-binding protein 1C [Thermodesulfovibrionia bacterium]|nr:penicillin-binding protein 1C [Thermodesulfovibrionia bacterium]